MMNFFLSIFVIIELSLAAPIKLSAAPPIKLEAFPNAQEPSHNIKVENPPPLKLSDAFPNRAQAAPPIKLSQPQPVKFEKFNSEALPQIKVSSRAKFDNEGGIRGGPSRLLRHSNQAEANSSTTIHIVLPDGTYSNEPTYSNPTYSNEPTYSNPDYYDEYSELLYPDVDIQPRDQPEIQSVGVTDWGRVCCSACANYPGMERFQCFRSCEQTDSDRCTTGRQCIEFGEAAAVGVYKAACYDALQNCGVSAFSNEIYLDPQTCFEVAAGSCIARINEWFKVTTCPNYSVTLHNCWQNSYDSAVHEYCGR
eukprot:GHVL01030600.1.p1 GENE.GHVL01030600.1~~GHVL01030600.1.p1  ORF type:complete len:308 (+),score=56.68 GHVL01030600.1:59-982(+)